MNKLNASKWKEFTVGDLFEIVKPPVLHARQVVEDDNGIPYVVRTKFNNGIKFRVAKSGDMHPSPAGVITFGAENSTFFYQDEEFVSGRDIYYLDTQELSKETCLFLTACLQTITSKYSYNYGLFPKLLRNEIIKLPVTKIGTPDWDYMKQYMRAVLSQSKNDLGMLKKISNDKHKININKWKEFHLYDDHMFKIDMGNKFDRRKMDTTVDRINFVGRTAVNNGINATCDLYNGTEPYAAGDLTLALGGSIGSCFVQQKPFYTSQNVIVLIPKDNISFAAKLFVATIIHKESDMHYQAFVRELNKYIKKDFSIKLPTTKDGNPDWDYMEQYMQSVMTASRKEVAALRTVTDLEKVNSGI